MKRQKNYKDMILLFVALFTLIAVLISGCAKDDKASDSGDGLFTTGSYEASTEGFGGIAEEGVEITNYGLKVLEEWL